MAGRKNQFGSRRGGIGRTSVRPALCAVWAAAASAVVAPPLRASTYFWQGEASNDNWSNNSAWIGNAAPPSDGSAILQFDGADVTDAPAGDSPNMDSNWTIAGIEFNGSTGFTLQSAGGYTLTLDDGLEATANSAAETIDANLALGGTQTWTTSNNGLTVNALNLNTYALTIDAAGPTAFTGIVRGAGSLTKIGTGTLTLSGANTYGGGTTVSAGTLAITGGTVGTLGSNVTVDGAAGTAMTLGGNADGTGATLTASTLLVGNNNTGAFTQQGGTVAVGFGFEIGASGNGTFTQTGGIANGLSVELGVNSDPTAVGTLNLDGGIFITGEVTGGAGTSILNFDGGTLQAGLDTEALISNLTAANVQAGGAVIDTQGYNATILQPLLNDTAAGTLDGGLTKMGAGTLTLSGANTYTGDTTVSAGTLNLANTNAVPYSTVNLVSNGSALTFDSSVTANAFTLGGLSGSGNLPLQNNAATPAAISLSVGNDNGNTTYSGAMSGPGSLTKIGTGTLTLSGTNTYSGNTEVNAGTLAIAGGTVGTSDFGSSLTVDGAAGTSVSLEAGATLASFSTLVGLNKTGAFIQTGGAYTVGLLEIGNSSAASGAFTQQGGTINATNYYVGVSGIGTATQSGGTTSISEPLTLAYYSGSTGTYNLDGGTLTTSSVVGRDGTSTFNFSGGTLQASADSTTFVAGLTTAIVQSGGAIIDSNGHNVTITESLQHDPALGTIFDGGLIKVGSGTLTLTGAGNTYTGFTRINAGTLNLANTTAAQDSIVNLISTGGTLTFDSSVTANAFTLGGLSGSGNLSLQNNAATPAAIALSVGNDNDNTTYAGAMSGPGSLTKIGTGALTLSGTNTYGGTTTVSAGMLSITGTGQSVGSTFDVAGGVLQNNGAISGTTDVNAGGKAEGTGAYGFIYVNSGGIFHPGNSPGAVTTSDGFWGAGGSYQFDIDDATGSAGTNYSQWDILGALDITSGSAMATRFTIDVDSLTASDSPGEAPDFNPRQDYSFEIVTTTLGIKDFSAADIAIDTAGFSNPTDGTFSVSQVGNDMYLNYTAVPEPASLAMATPLAMGLLKRRRRAPRGKLSVAAN